MCILLCIYNINACIYIAALFERNLTRFYGVSQKVGIRNEQIIVKRSFGREIVSKIKCKRIVSFFQITTKYIILLISSMKSL